MKLFVELVNICEDSMEGNEQESYAYAESERELGIIDSGTS